MTLFGDYEDQDLSGAKGFTIQHRKCTQIESDWMHNQLVEWTKWLSQGSSQKPSQLLLTKPFIELEAETQIGDSLSNQEASILHYFAIDPIFQLVSPKEWFYPWAITKGL